MRPSFAVLSLSDSFCELWPRLAESNAADLLAGTAVPELSGLSECCCVVVAAGGAERAALRAVEELVSCGAPATAVVGVETDYRLTATLLRAGADNYFAFPADLGALRSWISEHVDQETASARAREFAADRRERFDFSRMVGASPCLLAALRYAEKVIPRENATVLVTGETGTGKELLARALHYNGPRAAQPFMEINCTALPENLLEAEIFGYEAGAFTDARSPKQGLFEAADGGTLFLDEIGDLSLGLQGKLLRVLEDKRVRRLGSVRDKALDVRVVAATHVDLRAAIASGRFRQDLYYRLSILPIHLPPLRERGQDILLLAAHFLTHFSREHSLPCPTIDPETRRALLSHSWPGNIRELRNAIERAMLLGDGTIHVEDLFLAGPPEPPRSASGLPFPASMDAIAQAAARAMTDWCGGNKSEAAKALGISRRHLYVLLAKEAQC
jgi:two-component system response regulator HydG